MATINLVWLLPAAFLSNLGGQWAAIWVAGYNPTIFDEPIGVVLGVWVRWIAFHSYKGSK